MASVIVEANSYDATVTVPDDGDANTAASVTAPGVGFQALANRLRYMKTRWDALVGIVNYVGPNDPATTPFAIGVLESVAAGAWSATAILNIGSRDVGDIIIANGVINARTPLGASYLKIGNSVSGATFAGCLYATAAGYNEISFYAYHRVVGAGNYTIALKNIDAANPMDVGDVACMSAVVYRP